MLKSLRSSSVTLSQSFDFVANCRDVVETFVAMVRGYLQEIAVDVPAVRTSAKLMVLNDALDNFLFTDIDSQYQLFRYLENTPGYVSPEELSFGTDSVTHCALGVLQQKSVKLTGQYVSICRVLLEVVLVHDKVFELCGHYNDLLRHLDSQGIMIDYMSGEAFKNASTSIASSELSCTNVTSEQFFLQLV